jgi:uncharacterized protein (TIGR02246 family)
LSGSFARWNDALKAKKFEKVAALYSSEELSFLPTVSPKFIRDAKSTRQYFMEFLKKLPDGTITNDNVQSFGKDAYLHTGMYTFMTGPEDDRKAVEARFSYMWRRVDNEWKIVHHHSSATPNLPKPVNAAVDLSDKMYPIAQVRLDSSCVFVFECSWFVGHHMHTTQVSLPCWLVYVS